MTTRTTNKPATKSPPKMAPKPKLQKPGIVPSSTPALEAAVTVPMGAAAPKALTKIDFILVLLTRPEGATLEQMVEATGWLPHTTRAALTGLKKKGHPLISSKAKGVRTYRVVTGQQEDSRTSAGRSARAA